MKLSHQADFWKGRRVFVTGGSGFIGTHLLTELVALGANVRGTIHDNDIVIPHGIEIDLTRKDETYALERYLQTFEPEIVFHLAAQSIINYAHEQLVPTMDININGVRNILIACKDIESIKSVVVVATDKVYGNEPIISHDIRPYGVDHPYNLSKLVGDLTAQLFGKMFDMPICIVRNGNVYGAGDNHFERIIPNMMSRCLANGQPDIRGDGTMLRDYIHVSEIVTGYLNAAYMQYHSPVTNILLYGSNRPYSVMEVAQTIWKVCGRDDLAPIFKPPLFGEIPSQHIVVDDLGLERAIGWKPEIDLEAGLRMTVDYYRMRKYED